MERKSPALRAMAMGVLLIGMFLASAAVDAKSCCKDTVARNNYDACRLVGARPPFCAAVNSCKIITGGTCPKDYPKINDFLNTAIIGVVDEARKEEAYATNDFCKLGCASSVCGNIIALHKSAGPVRELEEAVKEAVDRCNDACSQVCNKKFDIAVVAAK